MPIDHSSKYSTPALLGRRWIASQFAPACCGLGDLAGSRLTGLVVGLLFGFGVVVLPANSWGWPWAETGTSWRASDTGSDTSSGQEEPLVQVVAIDGTVHRLTLDSLDETDGLISSQGFTLPLDGIREIRTGHARLGDDPTTITVHLGGQGELHVRSLSLSDGQLRMATDLAEFQYPLVDVRGIRFPGVEGQAEWQSLIDEPSREADRLLVSTSRGPRVVAGLLEDITDGEVRIFFEDQSRQVARDRILAIVPALLGQRMEAKYMIATIDGSRLIADAISFRQEQWSLHWKDQQVQLPAQHVVQVTIRSDRVLYLSDLDPVIDQLQTILAPDRVNRRNVSVIGTPLRLRVPTGRAGEQANGSETTAADLTSARHKVQEFSTGWGTQARSRLVFEIPAGYTQLSGWVGIDAATGGQGLCQVSVLLDGIQVFSAEVSGPGSALPLNVPLGSARRLELLVEPGPMLDLSAWLNWADVRLLK